MSCSPPRHQQTAFFGKVEVRRSSFILLEHWGMKADWTGYKKLYPPSGKMVKKIQLALEGKLLYPNWLFLLEMRLKKLHPKGMITRIH